MSGAAGQGSRVLKRACLLAVTALVSVSPAVVPPVEARASDRPSQNAGTADRAVIDLHSGWKFRFGDEPASVIDAAFPDDGWETISVPHTWNRAGYYDWQKPAGVTAAQMEDKRQGVGWYRLKFPAPSAGASDDRFWLEFDAASRVAEVWLNGVKLGSHAGGFSRFRFDATDALRRDGANILAVRVDNTPPAPGKATADTFPLTGDFFVYGGLYRRVRLIRTSAVHFDMKDFGGPGVYASTSAIAGHTAQVAVRGRVSNDSPATRTMRVRLQLLDAKGLLAAGATVPVTVAAGQTVELSRTLEVPNAHLWHGVSDPYLYTLLAAIEGANGRSLDIKSQPFGLRQIRIDPDKGLFLNGRHVALHGVGLHQDRQGKGWALSDDDVARTMATIRDMGANTIRLTHYQHGQAIHRLADKYGLILWDEIPVVTAWTLTDEQTETPPGLLTDAHQQLAELIRQNENHASVAVWGIANEVDFGPGRPDFLGRPPAHVPSPVPLLKDLQALARKEDPGRPTVLATCCLGRGGEGIPDVGNITGALGANRYFGWYYGRPAELGPHLDDLHKRYPDQPLALTEYGAGGAISLHTDNPLGGPVDMGGHDQPEEYQTWLHVHTWPIIRERSYLWASWLWNSFDFATNVRKEGDSIDINTKGLVTFDGKTRKDAFYFYRANWSSAPTVHINGRRYRDRAYDVIDIAVFSNAASTGLTLNGRALGMRTDCPERLCVWHNVRLAPGDNKVVASARIGGKLATDTVSWHVAPAQAGVFRIDSGALLAASAQAGRFGSDAFFEGGAAGSTDKHPRGRPAVLAQIADTADRDLIATFREGTFSYALPLADGRYRVDLGFVEPSAGPGERVFDVSANGQTVIHDLDLASVAGGTLHAIHRDFTVDVKNGELMLRFVPSKGKAIVSSINVAPVR